jgi:hypothetical protein
MRTGDVDAATHARLEVHGHMAAIVLCLDVADACPTQRAELMASVAEQADALTAELDRLDQLTAADTPAPVT